MDCDIIVFYVAEIAMWPQLRLH